MSPLILSYAQVIATVIIGILIPLCAFLFRANTKKLGAFREDMLTNLHGMNSMVEKIDKKIDAHIVWHLNGGEK